MEKKNMLSIFLILSVILLVVGALVWIFQDDEAPQQQVVQSKPIIQYNMKIENIVFKNNEYIPAKFTCDGINVNPSLRIVDVPTDAKSLALIMDDPDAPAGTFVHWVMWNIDPKTSDIAENSVPTGAVQGTNSGNEAKYMGPCPPNGTHHYFFKLYALDEALNLPASTTSSGLEQAMQGHVIAQTEMVGLYER